jgi:hypothetical protein
MRAPSDIIDGCIANEQEARFLQRIREMQPEERRAVATFLAEHEAGAPAYESALRFAIAMGHAHEEADEWATRWAVGGANNA